MEGEKDWCVRRMEGVAGSGGASGAALGGSAANIGRGQMAIVEWTMLERLPAGNSGLRSTLTTDNATRFTSAGFIEPIA